VTLFRFAHEIVDWPWAVPDYLPVGDTSPSIIVREGTLSYERDRREQGSLSPFVGPSIRTLGDDGYLLDFQRLATFLVSPCGDRIIFESGTDRETLQHLLLDQVLPRVIAHRDHLVLHAGAVDLGGTAIAFAGETGRGKSTLTGAFEVAGFAGLSDDGLIVQSNAGGVSVSPTYPSLRLWPDSVGGVFDEEPVMAPMAHYSTKRRVARAAAAVEVRQRPLVALYLLAAPAERSNTIEVRPIPARQATISLIHNAFQLDTSDRRRAASLLDSAVEVAAAVPAFELSYPRDYRRLDEVTQAILKHVTEEVRRRPGQCA
jgi:hypothetical protein